MSSPLSSGYTPPSDAPLRSWGEKDPAEPTEAQPKKRLPRCTVLLLAAVVIAVIVCVAVAVPLSLRKDSNEDSDSEQARTGSDEPSSSSDDALGRALNLSPAEQSETLETFVSPFAASFMDSRIHAVSAELLATFVGGSSKELARFGVTDLANSFGAESLQWSNELAEQATQLAAECTLDVPRAMSYN